MRQRAVTARLLLAAPVAGARHVLPLVRGAAGLARRAARQRPALGVGGADGPRVLEAALDAAGDDVAAGVLARVLPAHGGGGGVLG